MLHRKGASKLAVCAAMACSTVAGAEELTGAGRNQDVRPLYLQDASQPATAPSTEPAATPPRPFMALLDAIGIGKPLDDAGITIGGYIEGGYTVATNDPPGHALSGRVFDTKNNKIVLDQFNLFFDRPVDYAKAAANHTVDIGGHMDFIFGWDSGLIHSSGIYDNPNVAGVTKGYYKSRTSPENQADFNQAFVDIALPIGSGLRIRAGKFITLLGSEVINPTQNAFYSHSYMFGYAIPFTHTGVYAEYKVCDDVLVDAGVTRGWNQTFRDNNGSPDILAGVTITPQESDELKKWTFIVNLSEGPQATHDNHDWWTVLDFQVKYALDAKTNVGANIDYGDAPGAVGSAAAQWYGIAGYGSYVICDYVTANVRAEYYGDNKSFTFNGDSGLYANALIPRRTANLYEATVNLQIKPMPKNAIGQNLVIRPELRLDYGEHHIPGGSKNYQATFGIDAYFMF